MPAVVNADETGDRGQGELQLSDTEKKALARTLRSFETGINDGVVRFFDGRDAVACHGDSARFIARRMLKTENSVKYLKCDGEDIPSVVLNRSLFERALRDLLLENADFCVELYQENRGSWHLARSASPGKLTEFEEELFRGSELSDLPVVACARVAWRGGQRKVGIAYTNSIGRELGACEVSDDEQLNTLEAALFQLGAKEVVVPKEDASTVEGKKLREVIDKCNAMAIEQKPGTFRNNNLEIDLSKLLASHVEQHRAILELESAAAALSGLISYAELLSDESGYGKHTLHLYNIGKFMRLDSAALRALNVFKGKAEASDSFSLYGLLNKCKTPMGKRLLARWLKQPLKQVEEINTRQDIVEAFHNCAELRENIRSAHFRQFADIERLTRKLERKKASILDLCKLYQASCALPALADSLSRDCEAKHEELLRTRYVEHLSKLHADEQLGQFEALMEAAVDLSKIPDEYVIAPSYDPKLGEIQGEKDQVDRQMNSLWDETCSDLGISKEKLKLEHNHQHGWFWRLTKKEETQVRGKLQSKYLTFESRKEGTKFTSKKLKQLSESRQELDRTYASQQRQLVDKVVDVASSFAELFLQAATHVAELDVLSSFAEVAATSASTYTRPAIRETSANKLMISECRHPCIEVQGGVNFVPNDCTIEPGKSSFQIVTGPNMAGKSTFIRQVGVCVLMAQVGCFVPATSAEISVRDAIFCRVGAGDCQLRGISTFMAEMLEAASIMKGATSSSLVIIDELGRGTSTYDGFGLAWAISEHLCNNIQVPSLFATHFHELTKLNGTGGVKNLHVDAKLDPENSKLTMLHQLKEGVSSKSFGIECAELAKMPQEVIDTARRKQKELEEQQADHMEPSTSHKHHDTAAGIKRKRDAETADDGSGRERLQRFLSDFKALDVPSLTADEALKEAKGLKNQLLQDAQNNDWLIRSLGLA